MKLDQMAVYGRLPIWGQNLACYAQGKKIARTRYGQLFWEALAAYASRDSWTYGQLCEYRDKRLRRLIRHCYQTVPYYRDLFREQGICPESIRTLSDLEKLPILTKDMIKECPEKFLSEAFPPRKMISAHTSGTTGAGFVFQTTQRAQCEQWAVWWRYRYRLGIPYGTWCALFGGRSIVPAAQQKPPFYRINKPGRQIYFSAYHMNGRNMPDYVDALIRYRLRWIHGYPSSIALLANYMAEHGITLPYKVKWVTTGAENLLDWQKAAIYQAFGVEPYQHYGMAEGVSNLSEDRGHVYHIDEDFACTEFIYGREFDSYKIIGTNLVNFAMPLLRYDTGDLALLKDGECRQAVSIDGRREDYLVLRNGVRLGRLDHIFKDMPHVKEAQIKQDREGNIQFLVVRGSQYTASDEQRLGHEIKSRLGDEPYQIVYPQEIEKSKSGKLRFVVSKMQEQ